MSYTLFKVQDAADTESVVTKNRWECVRWKNIQYWIIRFMFINVAVADTGNALLT